jgi:ribosome-binding factor A
LGVPEDATASLHVLEGAAGFLRHQLGSPLAMRHVPQLHFKQDHSLEEGARLSALIDTAVRGDQHDDDETEN